MKALDFHLIIENNSKRLKYHAVSIELATGSHGKQF
jgi:hypothetical protein